MTDISEHLIEATGLGLEFQPEQPVLQDLNFHIARGEFVTLLGPSGCGKSTLLRLIAGLLKPTRGRISLDGRSPANDAERRVGLVFQDPVLLPWRSVRRNILLPLELSNARDPLPVSDLLNLVGLREEDADKRPGQLSGGMRMRVSLARALVTQPELFLLDEPFAALDDILRQQLNEELLRIRQQQGCTTVFVTHNVAEAVFLSQRILILSDNPATIRANLDVPLEYPRAPELRGTAEFAGFVQTVTDQLRGVTG